MEFIDFIIFLRRLIVGTVNWRIVRTLGELQILTRISYGMLIIVPVLATLWPGVRSLINEYNKISVSSANLSESQTAVIHNRLTDARAALNKVSSKESDTKSSVENVLFSLESIDEAISLPTGKTIISSNLPKSWSLGFFAALFAVIGHFIYQARAPEIVRRYTIDEYTRQSRDDYVQFPSPEKLNGALRNIIYDERENRSAIKIVSERDQASPPRPPTARELMIQYESLMPQAAISTTARDALSGIEDQLSQLLGRENYDGFIKQCNASAIERSARISYIRQGTGNPLAFFGCLFCYVGSIYCIFLVGWGQTRSILTATGLPMTELFFVR